MIPPASLSLSLPCMSTRVYVEPLTVLYLHTPHALKAVSSEVRVVKTCAIISLVLNYTFVNTC